MMLCRVALYFVFLLPISCLAHALPTDWLRVGQAELKVLWFDIYKAELFTPSGAFANDREPLMLKLSYKRDISRNKLLKETAKELRRFADEKQMRVWLDLLSEFWPDLSKGDQLAFYRNMQGEGHFFYNSQWLGAIKEAGFSETFVKIWLSDNSRFPHLAASLRG